MWVRAKVLRTKRTGCISNSEMAEPRASSPACTATVTYCLVSSVASVYSCDMRVRHVLWPGDRYVHCCMPLHTCGMVLLITSSRKAWSDGVSAIPSSPSLVRSQ